MERCLERDGSLAEAELELWMPVGDMEYFAGIKLFNKVIDRIGVDMDVWYIGDQYQCDIVGASAAGLFPVWYIWAIDMKYEPK